MALNFPSNPVLNQQYRYGVRTWVWNGTAWQLLVNPAFGYGSTSVNGDLVVSGSLTVNGTTTTINATTVAVDDKNIELGSVDTPTDTTADGGGITLRGGTNKTFSWVNANTAWTSSENLDVAINRTYKINGTNIISGTAAALVVGGNATTSLTLGNASGTVSFAGTLSLTSPSISTSITTASTTFNLINTTATTLNIGGAASTISIGASSGTLTLNNATVSFGATGTVSLSYPNATTIQYTGGASATTVTWHSGSSVTHTLGANTTSFTLGGTNTSTLTANLFANATLTGNTKTVNLGTAGASGSTTNINIGSAVSGATSTVNLQGGVTITAGTATAAPLRFSAGTALTTPVSGAIEYATDGLYATANPGSTTTGAGRGLVSAPQMIFSLANSGAATTNTAVAAFASANDVLSVLEANKLYRFSGKYYVTSTFTSGTANIQLVFGFSNAATAIKYSYKTYSQTAATTTVAAVGTGSAGTGVQVSPSVTANVSYVIEFDGYFTTHATLTSTLTPQFQMSTTGSSTVVTAGSIFQVEKLGTATTTLIAGNWA